MARRPRKSHLENRSGRLALRPAKKPQHFTSLSPGIQIGYRRCQGAGRWVIRVSSGGAVWTRVIGLADDFEDADNEHVFSWFQAQDRARALARGKDTTGGGAPVSVDEALGQYADELKAREGDVENASRVRGHLTANLLSTPVSLVTADALWRWRGGLIKKGMKPATINRTINALKAALNFAADKDRSRIPNREEFRVGLKVLSVAANARNVILADEQVRAIVTAAWAHDPALGLFVETAATTGSRPSQIARLQVRHIKDDPPRLMMPPSRKGGRNKPTEERPVPIPASLLTKLRDAARGRAATETLVRRADGSRWKERPSDHRRPFAAVAESVGLPDITLYALRHSSVVRQLKARTPVAVVAKLHDTSVKMIEKHYAAFITDHTDALTRGAMLDLAQPAADANVVILPRKG